jgi:hypothetical protein
LIRGSRSGTEAVFSEFLGIPLLIIASPRGVRQSNHITVPLLLSRCWFLLAICTIVTKTRSAILALFMLHNLLYAANNRRQKRRNDSANICSFLLVLAQGDQ